jgi:hypothetical protein
LRHGGVRGEGNAGQSGLVATLERQQRCDS